MGSGSPANFAGSSISLYSRDLSLTPSALASGATTSRPSSASPASGTTADRRLADGKWPLMLTSPHRMHSIYQSVPPPDHAAIRLLLRDGGHSNGCDMPPN